MSNVQQLLEKVSHWDSDERFMAISDLCTALEKGEVSSDATLTRISEAIVERLRSDKSKEVQTVSVKCLSAMMSRMGNKSVTDVCQTLGQQLTSGDAEMRDVFAVGLKTLVKDAATEVGDAIAPVLCDQLIAGAESGDDATAAECLDILAPLLTRFGGRLAERHARLEPTMLRHLESADQSLRKRASAALAALSPALDQALLSHVMRTILDGIKRGGSGEVTHTLIHSLSGLSAAAGYRLGEFLEEAVSVLVEGVGDPDNAELQGPEGDDLREGCFQALRSFGSRCPAAMAPHMDRAVGVAHAFVGYDPNYAYGEDDDAGAGGGAAASAGDDDGDDEYDDYEDEYGEYEDAGGDDDGSWRVRRAALELISAAVRSHPQLLHTVYGGVLGSLVARTKEREENVRLEVVRAISTTLAHSSVAEDAAAGTGNGDGLARPQLRRQRSVGSALEAAAPSVQAALLRLVAEGAAGESRVAGDVAALAVGALTHLAEALHATGVSVPDSSAAVRALCPLARDAAVGIRLEAVSALRVLLLTQPPSALAGDLRDVSSVLEAASGDAWFKVAAEALRALPALARVCAAAAEAAEAERVFRILSRVLGDARVEQDVREVAAQACGEALVLSSALAAEAAVESFTALSAHLEGGLMRTVALRATAHALASASTRQLSLGPAIATVVQSCTTLLRQQDRLVRQGAMQALAAAASHPDFAAALSSELAADLAGRLAAAVQGDDTHGCREALAAAAAAVEGAPLASEPLATALVGTVVALVPSPTLTKGALAEAARFLAAVAEADVGASASELNRQLAAPLLKAAAMDRVATANVATCIGALISVSAADERAAAVQDFVDSAAATTEPARQLLAVTGLGAVGLRVPVPEAVFGALTAQLSAASDDVRGGAAEALGAAAGSEANSATFLPLLLAELRGGDHTYLLLRALRTALAGAADVPADVAADAITVLETHAQSEEDATRTIAGEAVGLLLAASPDAVLPTVAAMGADEASPARRAGALSAVRHALSRCRGRAGALRALDSVVRSLVGLVADPTVSVRRAAVGMLSACGHHAPALAKTHVAGDAAVMEGLCKCALPDKALIRKVDLGPFKHKIDDGLPVRKAVFACLTTLLRAIPEAVRVDDLRAAVLSGMQDELDVQSLAHGLVSTLARTHAGHILSWLEDLIGPAGSLRASVLNAKVIGNKLTGADLERAQDVVRSALRTVDAIGDVEGVAELRVFEDMRAAVAAAPVIAKLYEDVRGEA